MTPTWRTSTPTRSATSAPRSSPKAGCWGPLQLRAKQRRRTVRTRLVVAVAAVFVLAVGAVAGPSLLRPSFSIPASSVPDYAKTPPVTGPIQAVAVAPEGIKKVTNVDQLDPQVAFGVFPLGNGLKPAGLARTLDGGRSWTGWRLPDAYEPNSMAVYALNDETAIIDNLITRDGGGRGPYSRVGGDHRSRRSPLAGGSTRVRLGTAQAP
ncbi:hypothetical protein [Fodinicola feengrottensis]|uniref:hypothetical protein n=1 Tax=Fodinicola feengrottensis TaxID=435914 RepID=UPI0013D71290|nr:hypothetical protein [Fodinicola feengrottensis]